MAVVVAPLCLSAIASFWPSRIRRGPAREPEYFFRGGAPAPDALSLFTGAGSGAGSGAGPAERQTTADATDAARQDRGNSPARGPPPRSWRAPAGPRPGNSQR